MGAAGAGTREQTDSVETTLNYLAPMDEKPYAYNYTPPPGTVLTNRKTAREQVRVRDAWPIADRLSIDREGFLLVRKPTAVRDFYDEDEIRRVYYPECERVMVEATGAARAVVFDHIVRCETRSRAGQKSIKRPAKGVHNDYTLNSGPQRVRDFFPNQAEQLLRNRFAIINVWRPIRPVEESPLAVCDANSIALSDFADTDLLYPHRKGEIQSVRFSPRHRWYYFPAIGPDSAILLKCYDSAADGRARFTAHTAFDDPTSAPGAAARESIETRVFVFFAPTADKA